MRRLDFIKSLGALAIVPFIPFSKKRNSMDKGKLVRDLSHPADSDKFSYVSGLTPTSELDETEIVPYQQPQRMGDMTWERDYNGNLYLTEIKLPRHWWKDKEKKKHLVKWMKEEGVRYKKKDEWLRQAIEYKGEHPLATGTKWDWEY